MQTTLADRKLHAIKMIAKLENEDLLTLIEQVLSEEADEDWADALSDKERVDISEGLNDLDAGNKVDYDSFKEGLKKRFP